MSIIELAGNIEAVLKLDFAADDWKNAFAYSGFDPTKALENLSKLGWTVEDIKLACFIFVALGTDIKENGKLLKKHGDTLPAKIQHLKTNKGLKPSSNTLGPSDITLPRIAALYPGIVALYFGRYGRRNDKITAVPADIPAHYLWPGAIVLLPKSLQPAFKDWIRDQWSPAFKATYRENSVQAVLGGEARISKSYKATLWRTVGGVEKYRDDF